MSGPTPGQAAVLRPREGLLSLLTCPAQLVRRFGVQATEVFGCLRISEAVFLTDSASTRSNQERAGMNGDWHGMPGPLINCPCCGELIRAKSFTTCPHCCEVVDETIRSALNRKSRQLSPATRACILACALALAGWVAAMAWWAIVHR